jgi:hypothetical protein
MLETRFPRIPGDMGHAGTWNFPVRYRIVPGASPERVVRGGADGLLDVFIGAARGLVAEGVDGITTNCGFLSLVQPDLAAAVGVPVATSSLMQVDLVNRLLPPGKVAGILTISASTLTPTHLAKAGAPLDTPIGTTEGGQEFTRAIIGDELVLDTDLAEQDNVEAAKRLVADYPNVGAIVLECTNMTPYQAAIHRAVGLPVYSVEAFVAWFQRGLQPRQWSRDL